MCDKSACVTYLQSEATVKNNLLATETSQRMLETHKGQKVYLWEDVFSLPISNLTEQLVYFLINQI